MEDTDFYMPDENLSVIQEVPTGTDIQLFVKRDDLVHAYISGNKWRKLKYNLAEARRLGHAALLTFGGAFSNHIYAVAAAGQLFQFKTIGVIRGEEIKELNETLNFAAQCGMYLHFISRGDYRKKTEAGFIDRLKEKFGDFYMLPEGGTNLLAVKGASEILSPEDFAAYDYICVCCGTGGTMAGIIAASEGKSKILGFSALKGDFLTDEVSRLVEAFSGKKYANWKIISGYHFGGYAKSSPELQAFIQGFITKTSIPTEFVYTGKMFFGIFDLINRGYFPAGSKVLAIHTGGLRNQVF